MGPGFAPAWSRRLALLVGAVLAVVGLLAPTFDQMANIWLTSSTFNHCLLVPPISLYLIWLKRDELAATSPGVAPLGALYAGLNALLWIAGMLVSIAFVQQVAAYFNLAWDEVDELQALADLSDPKISIDTGGLSPLATELANRLAKHIGDLDEPTLRRLNEQLKAK